MKIKVSEFYDVTFNILAIKINYISIYGNEPVDTKIKITVPFTIAQKMNYLSVNLTCMRLIC